MNTHTHDKLLRAAREHVGWSQAEHARRANVTQSTVSNIECGAVAVLACTVKAGLKQLRDSLAHGHTDAQAAVLLEQLEVLLTPELADPKGAL